MEIAILTIGDELLNGDLADTNTARIARLLAEHSYPVVESATVGDIEGEIITSLKRLAESRDIVIVTGGLGPTDDDLTARAASRAFDRRLSLDDTALRQIRARFKVWGRPMHPRNEKQALLPVRSAVIANARGTAPGFRITSGDTDLFFLPGVPGEMLAMLQESVLPALKKRAPHPETRLQREFTLFGLPEPEVESRLHEANLPDGVTVAFAVEFPLVTVKLRARGTEAPQLVDKAELALRQVLDEHVVGSGAETMAGVTVRLLQNAGLTVALAESCTGGLIAKLLTDIPGASNILERSAVTYANQAKADWLDISMELLEDHGAVSEECATAMATGIRHASGATVGLAVTGIAGPDGGTDEKPVGTVFIAMSTSKEVRVECCRFNGDREQVRLRTALTALDWLRRLAIRNMMERGDRR